MCGKSFWAKLVCLFFCVDEKNEIAATEYLDSVVVLSGFFPNLNRLIHREKGEFLHNEIETSPSINNPEMF